jgi:hypothetical protein
MEKTFAMTAPADCPAHRERPQAITVTLLISGIKKQFVSPQGGKGNPPSVARHNCIGFRKMTDVRLYSICSYIVKAQRDWRFKSAGSL